MKKRGLAIFGASGRMGIEVAKLAPEFGFDVTASADRASGGVNLKADAVEVVIDFSAPEGTRKITEWCTKEKKPLVSGVTGVDEAQRDKFRAAGKEIPILWAPNMSLGVAVLVKTLENFRLLDGFDFQIEEIHHRRKVDQPSGTALLLQEALAKVVKQPLPPPLSVRGGGVFGVHRVLALAEEETIVFEHTALNRCVFARGALRAARWLIEKRPGFYSMENVLEDLMRRT